MNESLGKCLICNKDIRANDGSNLTDDRWKTLTNLVKTWSSLVLPIDHQYYMYIQLHELISDRKIAFCKHYHSGNGRPAFGTHSLINQLKKDNEADKASTKAATGSTSLRSDTSLLSSRSSTNRTHSRTGNTKEFEQICSACNEICPCDSHAQEEGALGVCEFKSAGDRLIIVYRSNAYFLNELLQDWLHVIKHYIIFMTLHTFVDSPSLGCKIWALENDWEVLLIWNPDH